MPPLVDSSLAVALTLHSALAHPDIATLTGGYAATGVRSQAGLVGHSQAATATEKQARCTAVRAAHRLDPAGGELVGLAGGSLPTRAGTVAHSPRIVAGHRQATVQQHMMAAGDSSPGDMHL